MFSVCARVFFRKTKYPFLLGSDDEFYSYTSKGHFNESYFLSHSLVITINYLNVFDYNDAAIHRVCKQWHLLHDQSL